MMQYGVTQTSASDAENFKLAHHGGSEPKYMELFPTSNRSFSLRRRSLCGQGNIAATRESFDATLDHDRGPDHRPESHRNSAWCCDDACDDRIHARTCDATDLTASGALYGCGWRCRI